MPHRKSLSMDPRVWAVVAFAILLSLVFVLPAGAHVGLTGSDPQDGAAIDTLERVRLEFSGELLEIGAFVTLAHADGERFELEVEHAGEGVVVAEVGDVPGGDYTVEWRVVAADGHPIEGEFGFAYDAPVPAEPSPDPSPEVEAPASTTEPSPTAEPGPAEEPEPESGISPGVAVLLAGLAALVMTAWVVFARTRRA